MLCNLKTPPSKFNLQNSTFKTPNSKTAMFKRESWKLIIQVVISILTAIATTLGVTSCL